MSPFLAIALVWTALLGAFLAARTIAICREDWHANDRYSLTPLAAAVVQDPLEVSLAIGTCEEVCYACGCTDSRACPGGCYWVAPNLCSSCETEVEGEPDALYVPTDAAFAALNGRAL